MDIRTDSIGSGASFTLEVHFVSRDGRQAAMNLSVCCESCSSADGKMTGDVIYLFPEQEEGDVTVGDRSVFSATDLDELCDLLFGAATIVGWKDHNAEYNRYRAKVDGRTFAIDGKLKFYDSHKKLTARIEKLGGTVSGSVSSGVDYLICNDKDPGSRKAMKAREAGIPIITDLDFMFGLFVKDPDYDKDEDPDASRQTAAVRDVAPVTIGNFKKACAETGITLDDLAEITIQNRKFGTRDSAMFIFSDNDTFVSYKKRYRAASTEERPAIWEEFVSLVTAGPTLEVIDNEMLLPETMRCVWSSTEEHLREEMQRYLEGTGPGHWMGTYTKEFSIDFTTRSMTSREILLWGNI